MISIIPKKKLPCRQGLAHANDYAVLVSSRSCELGFRVHLHHPSARREAILCKWRRSLRAPRTEACLVAAPYRRRQRDHSIHSGLNAMLQHDDLYARWEAPAGTRARGQQDCHQHRARPSMGKRKCDDLDLPSGRVTVVAGEDGIGMWELRKQISSNIKVSLVFTPSTRNLVCPLLSQSQRVHLDLPWRTAWSDSMTCFVN